MTLNSRSMSALVWSQQVRIALPQKSLLIPSECVHQRAPRSEFLASRALVSGRFRERLKPFGLTAFSYVGPDLPNRSTQPSVCCIRIEPWVPGDAIL